MKAIIILLFITNAVFSQDTTKNKCPIGETYISGLNSSGMIVEDGCWPDSLAKKVIKEFYKNLCGETGFAGAGNGLAHSSIGTWDDSCGCVVKETWEKAVPVSKGSKKTKWVEITHEEYSELCKCEWIYVDDKKYPLFGKDKYKQP